MKYIGAIVTFAVCCGFGISYASDYRRQCQELSCLIRIMEYMKYELQCRLTNLPNLCLQASREGKGTIFRFFERLSQELLQHISPDVESCVKNILPEFKDRLSSTTGQYLLDFGHLMGRFNLESELNGMETILTSCRNQLNTLLKDKDGTVRSYKILGICGGIGIVILFI